jgi:hypothetical protein
MAIHRRGTTRVVFVSSELCQQQPAGGEAPPELIQKRRHQTQPAGPRRNCQACYLADERVRQLLDVTDRCPADAIGVLSQDPQFASYAG